MNISRYRDKERKKRDYTIGELARLYHIGTDSIRYYERKGVLEPVRGENSYRYYSSQSIWRMNVIMNLRSLNFSVNQIRDYFQNRTAATTEALLHDELSLIDAKVDELTQLKKSVLQQLSTLEHTKSIQFDRVIQQDLPDRNAFMIQERYSRDEDMDLLMKRLVEQSNGQIEMIGNNRMAAIISPQGGEDQFDGALIFDQRGETLIPGGTYLSIFYHGPTASRSHLKIVQQYAQLHSLTLHPPFLDIVWLDIHTATDPSEFVSEVQVRAT